MSATGLDLTASAALPITGARNDYDSLVDRIGDARCVLIGEASNGTHEFYVEHARMTRSLIEGASSTPSLSWIARRRCGRLTATPAGFPKATRPRRRIRSACRPQPPEPVIANP